MKKHHRTQQNMVAKKKEPRRCLDEKNLDDFQGEALNTGIYL